LFFGEKIVKPSDPTKEGYVFNGWYSDEDKTILWDFDNDIVTANLTLYADWIVNEAIQRGNITVTLIDSNGNPLANYPVELHSTVITGTTNENGKVTFSNVTLEDHELVVKNKNGDIIGTIILTMTSGDNNSTNINGNNVTIYFNESAVSIDLEIKISDSGALIVEAAEINVNPKTAGDSEIYVLIGQNEINVVPYIAVVLLIGLISGVYLMNNRRGIDN
jgi:uncharacterized repeat protein (TIGR02543 family)